MNKKLLFVSIFCLICAIAISAQSAEKIEQIVGEESLSWGQVSYLVAPCLNSETEDVSKSFDLLKEKGLVPSKKEISLDTKINLKEYSFVIAKVFNIKKSFWFTVTKSQHYAFKMLKNIHFIEDKQASKDAVSGRMAIRLIQDAMSLQGSNDSKVSENSESGDLQ